MAEPHEFCQCGHRAQSHDDEYGYCKAVVEPPAETAGYELKYWPCPCRRLIFAERPCDAYTSDLNTVEE